MKTLRFSFGGIRNELIRGTVKVRCFRNKVRLRWWKKRRRMMWMELPGKRQT